MNLKITANPEARRVTIWTDVDTSPADLGQALDSIIAWPDFRPGISILEIFRGPAGPATVTRAMRSLGNRARRLGLRHWAIVASDNLEGLPQRTWAGIAGVVVVKMAAFDSVVNAIDWLNEEAAAHDSDVAPTPQEPAATASRRSKFNAPSATGFHPNPFLSKPGDKDVTVVRSPK